MRPLLFSLLLLAAGPVLADQQTTGKLVNKTAYIPPQCYTETRTRTGVANPCMTCHVRSRAPHYINDYDLQFDYSFPAPARVNPWTNLFADRRDDIAAMPDDQIMTYVRQSNYIAQGGNLLAQRLTGDLPEGWDQDGDGRWSGYVPDLALNFDPEGFDIAADGTPTGWRAFAYTPLPGSFWPTNGSGDDVLIRLPEIYRQAEDGQPDRQIYTLNLAITEALIKRQDVPIAATDEAPLGVDLDRDGQIGQALKVGFDWAPRQGRDMQWVGAARLAQQRGDAPLAAGLYPLGTEFIHSLRYLDVQDGKVVMAPRMKELRYMRKTRWLTWFDREDGALAEAKERVDFPDRIAMFFGDSETGISNGTGWRLQAFIEDATGDLRPQNFEETVFCMGCHGGIGVNDDDTFAFPRKLAANTAQGGWWHWTQRDGLAGVAQPVRADGNPEYAFYLRANRGGDELRANTEVIRTYLRDNGTLDPGHSQALLTDIGPLVTPSAKRAVALNKAYRLIVQEQSFIRGRDAVLAPATTVHRSLPEGETTGITTEIAPWYSLRPVRH